VKDYTKTKKEEVKDGPSYTPNCLWRRVEKMKMPRRLAIAFIFCLFSL